MKIALIQAPCWTIHQPPLAVAYLKSALKAGGFDVKAYDLGIDLYNKVSPKYHNIFEMNNGSYWIDRFDETIKTLNLNRHIVLWTDIILKDNPRIIGFSMYWTTTEISLLLAKNIKKKDPSKTVVFGGPSCLKEERALDFINLPFVDIVIIREGEGTLVELAKQIELGKELIGIKGALIKNDEQIMDNGERPLINDLNTIPFPDFDDFNLNNYAPFITIPVLTSRGCIGRCIFCLERNFWSCYRFRTANNIFEELKTNINKYKRKDFYFVDSLINGNLTQLAKLCTLIIDNNIKVNWGGMARIDKRMTSTLLTLMKKAGCQNLYYGIESGSQKVLNDMHKDVDIKTAEKVLRETYKAGIRAHCMFMIGYPTENLLDFFKTIIFVLKMSIFISSASPGSGCGIPPGSYLSKHLDEFDIQMGQGYSDWETKDGKNTLAVRKNRLKLFKLLCLIPSIKIGNLFIVNKYFHIMRNRIKHFSINFIKNAISTHHRTR